ncbi:MAG: lipid-A-disaccharide synthase [Vicingaceae bacterium]
MKYYVIAGEASGDLHGANLIRSLSTRDPNADFRCWGGDMMQEAGGKIIRHYRDLAFMGFLEVVSNLNTIRKNFNFCQKDITEFKADVLILIDYPGFNLRMAEFAHKRGLKVFYYISPQVWAWNRSRVHKIKRFVDRMFVILPFEESFYQEYNYHVDFVGHPLLDAISNGLQDVERSTFLERNHLENREIVAILPGSRKQEIKRMLPTMLAAAFYFPEAQFVIAGAPSIPIEFYRELMGDSKVPVVSGRTYALLRNSKAAIVTSGTATLETALFKVPEVVCYSGNYLSYLLARQLVKVKYISLVNLIMDEPIVKELIQTDFNKKNVKRELEMILKEGEYRQNMLANMSRLVDKLGGPGASDKTASLMLKYLTE